jgi:hypothetical protein
MKAFARKTLEYTPKKVINETLTDENSDIYTTIKSSDIVKEESIKVANRLLEHLKVIDEYNKRLDTIDYLINNAESLIQKELSYSTEDEDILEAIRSYGGTNNIVTFDMFKQSVDDILESYENMVITTLAGTNI